MHKNSNNIMHFVQKTERTKSIERGSFIQLNFRNFLHFNSKAKQPKRKPITSKPTIVPANAHITYFYLVEGACKQTVVVKIYSIFVLNKTPPYIERKEKVLY